MLWCRQSWTVRPVLRKRRAGHQLSSAPGPPHVVLAVRWDRLTTSAPARPSRSRAAEVESPPRESDPDPATAGPARRERAGRPDARLFAFGYLPCVIRMIVLPATRRSGANADGTSASGRTAPTIGFS